jgi:hypothetical protein
LGAPAREIDAPTVGAEMLQLSYIGAFVAIIAVHFSVADLSNGMKLAIDMVAGTWIAVVLLLRHGRAASPTEDKPKAGN